MSERIAMPAHVRFRAGLLAVLAIWCLLSAPGAGFSGGAAQAAPGDSGGGSSAPLPSEPRRVRHDSALDAVGQRMLPASVRIQGTVRDPSGAPMADVRVRLFWNGASLEAVRTDVDGTFAMSENPPSGENHTVDLWFESPDLERYVDVNVVLAAGRSARENGIFSSCTPQVSVSGRGATVDVTMLSLDENKKLVQESGCLKSES